MNFRIALGNLLRNRWRSALTAGGIAVATAFLVWMTSMNGAFLDLMVETAISAEIGHIQVHSTAYIEEPTLQSTFDQDPAFMKRLVEAEGVEQIAPRVQAMGLVGNKSRSRVARIIGVDARLESQVSNVASTVMSGSWLSDEPSGPGEPREVVLGEALARQLQVSPGGDDELAVLLQGADGSLGNDLLKVVGLVKTGNSLIDRTSCYMHLGDAQYLVALEGRLHEVSIRLQDSGMAGVVVDNLRTRVGDGGEDSAVAVRPWREIVPELEQLIVMSEKQGWFIYFVIFLIAGLAILNAQRMSALERRREFGVLLAIGLAPRRLASLIVLETALISVIGGLVGLSLGGVMVWYHATEGLDFASLGGGSSSEGISFMGVNLGGKIFFDPTLMHFLGPGLGVTLLGALCGLLPARYASRLDAAQAISGRS
ncbi:MAG: FtsX-like permease family protein [Myxococcota bacterium]|nr:FtsX-like permease family protein [Myxococcota bacterium]